MLGGLMTMSQSQNKLPLDVYNTNPIGAYGLRKLRTNWTGNCIRIRRASDNSEINVGFTSTGVVNTSTIASHCSGTTGYIVTWYDQSGAGNNATQVTAAQQMIIYQSGAVPTINGKPAALSTGIMGYLISKTSSVQISTHLVFASSEAIPSWGLWHNGTNQYAGVADATAGGTIYSQATAASEHWVNGQLTTLTQRLQWRNTFTQNTLKILSQCAWTPSSTWGAGINLFNYNDATYKIEGYLCEWIMYYNDSSIYREEIEQNIREYYRLWS